MKTKVLAVALAVVLFTGWGMAAAVLAAEKAGAQTEANPEALYVTGSLGTAAGATDVWHVQCGYGSNRLAVYVQDGNLADGINLSILATDAGGVPAISAISCG